MIMNLSGSVFRLFIFLALLIKYPESLLANTDLSALYNTSEVFSGLVEVDSEQEKEVSAGLDGSSWKYLGYIPYANNDSSVLMQQRAIASFAFSSFLFIRAMTGSRNLPSLVNALITGPSGIYFYAHQNKTVTDIVTGPPVTDYQLENIIPLVLYGYGGYEMMVSLYKRDWLFALHGSVLVAGSAASHDAGKMQLSMFGQVVELSQIFYHLGLMHKRYYGLNKPSPYFFILFTGAFFATRWVILPYEYAKFIRDSYLNEDNYQQEPAMINTIAVGGALISALNLYWGIKIISKMREILFQ